jgi:hypothetical protein
MPGNIGRFFVRDALIEVIDALKTDKDIVEPSEREALDALHLDADRQGVPGSPDLARPSSTRSKRRRSSSPMSRWSALLRTARSSSTPMSLLNTVMRITR